MQKSLIRTPAENEARKETVQQNRQKLMQLSNIKNSNSVSTFKDLYVCQKLHRNDFKRDSNNNSK